MTTKTMLKSWFSHIRTPFIANAPMLGSTDAGLAAAVSKAGGFGKANSLQKHGNKSPIGSANTIGYQASLAADSISLPNLHKSPP